MTDKVFLPISGISLSANGIYVPRKKINKLHNLIIDWVIDNE